MMEQENQYRLPPGVEPKRYVIRLTPNPALFVHTGDEPPPAETLIFKGTESIFVEILEPTDRITLNAVGLEIDLPEYVDLSSKKTHVASAVQFNEEMQTATIVFEEDLPIGFGNLEISFRGKIDNNLEGQYLLKYPAGGTMHYGVATQFEATDARRAFPCWDEPAKKAIFALTLVIPNHADACSNTDPFYRGIAGEKGEFREINFLDTMKMSSYLLAWTVKQIETITEDATFTFEEDDGTINSHDVRLGFVADPGESEQGRFAMHVHRASMQFYTNFFRVHFSGRKNDLIALADFGSGAMENPGAITFRKTAVQVDECHASVAVKRRVGDVVAHENAHMWFGDLVTMKWWNGLWLNEGFATFMEYLSQMEIFPEWQKRLDLFVSQTTTALYSASRSHARAIENPVFNPAQIGESFDAFAYSMGASILWMLYQYLGRDDFRKGMHLYLTRHAYSNAETEDLWAALEEVSGKPVRKIMHEWVFTPGYPMLSVSRSEKDQKMLVLEQCRFFANGKGDHANAKWNVPMTIATESGARITILVDAHTKYVRLPESATGWVKVNTGQDAFCRVRYEASMLAELAPAIQTKELLPEDRIGLLNDTFALARAGHIRTSEALEILMAYRDDDDYYVWATIAQNLGMLDTVLGDEPFHDRFDAFARDFYLPHARRHGWAKMENESDLTTQFRSLALHGAGHHGAQEVILRAKSEFAAHLEHKSLDPNLRSLVYALTAKEGGEMEYHELHQLLKESATDQEKSWIRNALGKIKDEKLFSEYLHFLLTERKQDVPIGFAQLENHGKRQRIAWEFIKAHWDFFTKECSGHRMLSYVIESASRFHDEESLRDVQDFFAVHTHPTITRAVAELIEDIETDMHWLERLREENIGAWLEAHTPEANGY